MRFGGGTRLAQAPAAGKWWRVSTLVQLLGSRPPWGVPLGADACCALPGSAPLAEQGEEVTGSPVLATEAREMSPPSP